MSNKVNDELRERIWEEFKEGLWKAYKVIRDSFEPCGMVYGYTQYGASKQVAGLWFNAEKMKFEVKGESSSYWLNKTKYTEWVISDDDWTNWDMDKEDFMNVIHEMDYNRRDLEEYLEECYEIASDYLEEKAL